jgi:hypothetical protein
MAIGLMQHATYATNADLDREEREIFEEARSLQENRATVLPTNLAAHVDVCWQAAYQARASGGKTGIDDIMLQCMRAREAIYDPEDMAEIEAFGGSQIYMNVTDNKCVAFEAWTRDVMLPPGEKPWTIEPTECPDLPDEIEAQIGMQVMMEAQAFLIRYGPQALTTQLVAMRLEELRRKVMQQEKQYADVVTARYEEKIEDDYQEGGFYTAIDQFISDLATFPAAFIKGPCMKRRKALVWQPDQSGGQSVPVIQDVIRKEYKRVSPLDCYPSPSSRAVNDGYFIERMRLRMQDIQQLTGMEDSGYKDDEVRLVLQEAKGGAGGFRLSVPTDQSRQELENRNESDDSEGIIDCLNYWGHVQGVKLLEYGMDRARVPDPDLYYHSNIWKIGTHVIMARLNPHPLGETPYYSSSFRPKADSIWGKSPPMCMRASARAGNGAARAMMNNAAIACLTGDTVVYREGQSRKYSAITIDELWEKKTQPNSGLKRIKLRSLDEATGEFISNPIVDIIDNGIGDIFEVMTERGYKIKATGNHRFINTVGEWQTLDQFDVGEMIGVNGQSAPLPSKCIDCGEPIVSKKALRCRSCGNKHQWKSRKRAPVICIECGHELKSRNGVRCRSCASRNSNSVWNKLQIEQSRNNFDVSGTTARYRYDCQSQKKDFCQLCGKHGGRLEVHHKDRVPWNNESSNLETFCSTCHHALHTREDSFGDAYLHRYLSFDRIVSITYVGQERVFDLCMLAPNHNFVSNGFLSHNSGPQVEVDISRIDPATNPMVIMPWGLWKNNGKQGPTEGPAVRFFMPPLVVKELLVIFQWSSEQESEESGIPNSIYGGQGKMGSGAADTYSGYAMITNAANKTLGGVVFHIDQNVIVPATRNHWLHLMLYDDSMTKGGDINVVARASRFLIVAEQIRQSLAEFSRDTNNKIDLEIMGIEGRAELLRERARFLRTKSNKIIPDEEKLKARLMEQAGMVQDQPQNGGQPKPGQRQIPEKAGPQTKPTAGRPRPGMEQQGGRGPSQGPRQPQGQGQGQGMQRPMQPPQQGGM